jgi:hypothetical protein
MDIGNYLPPYSAHVKGHPDMINIFNYLTVTKLSFYILLFGLILSVIVIFTVKLGVGYKALAGLLLFLTFCIESYTVNCIQLGHCTTWASILTVLYVGYAVALSFLVLFKRADPLDVFKQYKNMY